MFVKYGRRVGTDGYALYRRKWRDRLPGTPSKVYRVRADQEGRVKRLAVVIALLAVVLLQGCSGGDDSEELEALRRANEELRQQLAEAQAPVSTPSPTATVAPTPTATPTAEPTPSPTASPLVVRRARLIAGTGGEGVSLRDACRDEARVPGAIAEGTEVLVTAVGLAKCATWSMVLHQDSEVWVRDDYLVPTPTPEPTPRPPTAPLVIESWRCYTDTSIGFASSRAR